MNVTYEDAEKAVNGVNLTELNQARDFYEAHLKEHPEWSEIGALAVVFAAGRVDGVRQERARRRRKGGAA